MAGGRSRLETKAVAAANVANRLPTALVASVVVFALRVATITAAAIGTPIPISTVTTCVSLLHVGSSAASNQSAQAQTGGRNASEGQPVRRP